MFVKFPQADITGQSRISNSNYAQLRSLKACCDNGRVTLQGRLPTYFLKRVAQQAIQLVPGVRDIDNDVKVTGKR